MKIEGIVLEENHKGEEVTYFEPNVGSVDVGTISSWNDTFVFVKYQSSNTSQATKPEELYWGDRMGEFRIKNEIIKEYELRGILNVDDFIIYISGKNDNNLSVIVSFNDEVILSLLCSMNDSQCKIYPVYEEKKKELRRKIQIEKIL